MAASLLLAAGWAWQRRSDAERSADRYTDLAWTARRGDAAGLAPEQEAFLEGHFEEALRRAGKPSDARDRGIQRTMFQAALNDVPWPDQVLLTHTLVATAGSRLVPLLARAVSGGYSADHGKVRLDVFTWDGKKLQRSKLPARDARGRSSDAEVKWTAITEMQTVHLDRKDTDLNQLYVAGRQTDGKARVEIYYGADTWKRWAVTSSVPPQLDSDRIRVPGGSTYKLLDDEWVEIR